MLFVYEVKYVDHYLNLTGVSCNTCDVYSGELSARTVGFAYFGGLNDLIRGIRSSLLQIMEQQ
jgi:hypothetical protein